MWTCGGLPSQTTVRSSLQILLPFHVNASFVGRLRRFEYALVPVAVVPCQLRATCYVAVVSVGSRALAPLLAPFQNRRACACLHALETSLANRPAACEVTWLRREAAKQAVAFS